MTLNGIRSYNNVDAETLVFPILAKARIDGELQINFEHFHTRGSHLIYDIDKYGNSIAPTTSRAGYYGKAYFVLHQMAALMEAYRKRGIYDNSVIVIMADHGRVEYIPECAKPML